MTKLDDNFLEKYSRQIMMNEVGIEGQKRISSSSVSIIGCGGLGTSAAQYLAMSGVSNLTLIDHDHVTLSNLNRQTLFTEKDLGCSKTETLSKRLKEINSNIKIDNSKVRLNENNINKLISKNSIVLDCTDNFQSRFTINNFCHKKKYILVSSALQNFEIQSFIFASWKNKKNPCYNCIFPNYENDDDLSCEQMGIISTVAGLGGIFQATLVLNYLLNLKTNFREFIMFDCLNLNLKKIKIKKNCHCKICVD